LTAKIQRNYKLKYHLTFEIAVKEMNDFFIFSKKKNKA